MMRLLGNKCFFPDKAHHVTPPVMMAEVEDHTLLFCFNFIVEKFKSSVHTDCFHPQGVSFRLLDFPTVRLALPVPSNLEKGDVIKGQVLSKDGALKLNKGKSCTFRMTLDSLVRGLRESPMVVQFVNLTPGGGAEDKQSSEIRDQRVVGSALLDLSGIAAALECAAKGKGATTKCSAGGRKKLRFVDASGTKLTNLHVRYQLSSEGPHAGPHITRENKSDHSTLQHHQNAKQNTGSLGSHEHKYSKGNQFVAEKVSSNNETSLEPLGVESELSGINESQTLGACVYLPNAVCPPPLFYHSNPKPHDMTKTGGFVQPTVQHAEIMNDNVGYPSDSAQSHWSVLMAHDEASHPLTVKYSPCHTANLVETGETNSALNNKRVTSLPLLTALLEELSVLQSQILPPAVQTTEILKPEPQKASKCLQTDLQLDDRPDSMSVQKLQESNKQDNPQCTTHQHLNTGHGRRFLRECCMLKHPSALRVPKHKSVIYPPDIARIKRKKFQKKVKHSTDTASFPPRMQKDAVKGARSQKQPKHSSIECSSDGSITGLGEISEKVDIIRDTSAEIVSSAVRKLDVFIPQASDPAESSQASSSRPSIVSLKSHDEDLPIFIGQTDAEAQTHVNQLMDAGTQTNLLLNAESVVATVTKRKDQKGTSVDVPQSYQGTTLQSPNLSSQEDKSRKLSTRTQSVAQRADSQGVPQETQDSLNGGENADSVTHKQTLFAAKSFAASNVNIVVTHTGNLLQEPPTPRSVDNIPSLYASKKPSDLLNIASQTLDSFLSTNSLDVMGSTVLPKHQRDSILYLASSQSTCEAPSQQDEVELADQNNEDSYSQDYSDDFEQFDSDSDSKSTITSSST